MTIDALIRGALEWAAQGVPVFPCGADKAPLTKDGFKSGTTDPKRVRSLFEQHERHAALVGAVMGRASGLFAVDADLYKSPEVEAWVKAQQEQGNLPPTREHRTKRGGVHMIYASEDAWPNCKPIDGIDVKGEGGYIIVPPSPGYTVEREGLSDAPRGLVRALEEARQARASAPNTALEAAILRGADFHDSMTQLAARKAAEGMPLVEIKAYIDNLLQCSDARHPTNSRHARWASFMRSSEVMNVVASAVQKFSTSEPSEALASVLGAERISGVAASIFSASPTVGEVEESFYAVGFPYSTADGYFAHTQVDLESENPIIEGICYENEVTLISADPKVGKTVFALDCALSVAHGYNLAGNLRVASSGPTLYFGLEGRAAIRKRVAAWRKKRDLGPDVEAQFFAVERAANFYEPTRRDTELNKIIQADRYWDAKGSGKLKLIVIDTLTKAMIGGNQNDADDTAQLFEFVAILRDQGITACIVLVHHKRKAQKGDPGEGPRGSGNILAECDISLHLSREETGPVKIHVAEARSIESGADYYRAMVSVPLFTDDLGNEVSSVCMEEAEEPSEEPEISSLLRSEMDRRVYSGICLLGSGTHSAQEILETVLRKTLLTGKLYKAEKWYTKNTQDVLKGLFRGVVEHDGHMLRPSFGDNEKVVSVEVTGP